MNNSNNLNIIEKYNCPICFEEYQETNTVKLTCEHIFCKGCIKRLCEDKLKTHNLKEIICGVETCKTPINHYIIRSALSTTDFENYDKLLVQQMEVKNEKNEENEKKEKKERKVSCPSCETIGLIWEGAEYFTCAKCKNTYCSNEKCYGLWKEHEKLTCELYYEQRQTEHEKLFKELLKEKGWKQCPVCNTTVEKTKGCNYILCQSLHCQKKTSFCYICGKQIKSKEEENEHFPNGIFDQCVEINKKKNAADNGKSMLRNDVPINKDQKDLEKNEDQKENRDKKEKENYCERFKKFCCGWLPKSEKEKPQTINNEAKRSRNTTHEESKQPLLSEDENNQE